MRPSRPTSSLSKPATAAHDAEGRSVAEGASSIAAPARAAAASNSRASSTDSRSTSRSAAAVNLRKSLLASSPVMRVATRACVTGFVRSGCTWSPRTWPAKRRATRNAVSIALSALSGCPTGTRMVR